MNKQARIRFLTAIAAALPVMAVAQQASAQQRVYIGNDDHTDYFWTGTDVQYRAAFNAMLDYYMTQAESTATGSSGCRTAALRDSPARL